MTLPSLTGAQKTKLRGLGQTTADGAYLGKEGVTPGFVADFNRLLDARELIKLRFTAGQDRHERAALCETLATAAGCLCLGKVGHTALFWRPGPEGSKLLTA
jgi:RNA-binding protein